MKVFPFFIPHAGCPYRCRFCQQQWVSGHSVVPSPAQVAEELPLLLPEQGDGEVAFYGGSFTLLEPALQRDYLRRVRPFIEKGQVAGIRISTRPDALDEEQLTLLQQGGVTTVELGCQSFSAEVLEAAGRGHGPLSAGRAVKRLRSRSLQVGLQLMPGLPGAAPVEALLSLRQALDLEPDFLRIYPTVVLRGTVLEADFQQGCYRPLALDDAVELCAEMLWHCREVGVPVIRLGLQATTALVPEQALVAGPYHPAFGALVRSRLWRRALAAVLAGQPGYELRVHPSDLSDVLGQRRDNWRYFEERGRCLTLLCDKGMARDHFGIEGRNYPLQAAAAFPPISTLL
ncbi:MAG: radical SAM protein [Desulfuromonadaceae bacterium]|nr:radical SAM protein [Desulfuromonadaceae bacterium]